VAVLAEDGQLIIENGFVRRRDGTLYVAVTTDLGTEVTGEMFDWWFCNVDNTEKYKWWHPEDHFTGIWDPPYYGAMAFERPKGHYVDHVHIVEEAINGNKQSLQIEFQRPSKFFDVTKFAEQNITAMLVARVHVKDSTLGLVAAGHLVHMVKEEGGRSILHSHFWMGDVAYPETPENYFFAETVNFIANTYLFRVSKVPYTTGLGIYKHCAEEMACLREFLPHYYQAQLAANNEFIERFNFGN
jgi:hypothetical protein